MVLKNKGYSLSHTLFILFSLVFLPSQAQKPEGLPDYASVSALVKDLCTGEVVAAHQPKKNRLTASLMKLVTTATALDLLGKDFKFATRLWFTGSIHNGTLYGDLIIEGGGDPTLGSRYFPNQHPDSVLLRVKNILEKKCIKKINGQIFVDENYLQGSRYPSRRLWEDMGNYYGAPPAALTWRDNSLTVVLKSPPQIGAKCRVVSVFPQPDNITFNCRVISAKHNRDSAYIYGLPGLDMWEIRGSIPAGRNHFVIKGALPEPGLTFASEVGAIMDKNGNIPIEKITSTNITTNIQLAGEIESPPLSEIIKELNQHSLNLAADHLLIALGKKRASQNISEWDSGLQQIKHYWQRKDEQFCLNIKDGSGLAPQSTLSPAFLVEMLTTIYQDSLLFETFKNSLAISGESGTLKHFGKQAPLKGIIYGKSGSMKDVLGYAGYIFRNNEHPLVFCVMVNHHGKKNSDIRKCLENWLEKIVQP
ncbi:D-alanyl-D-alanine carboxypeptidase/D-alanyl-D-alanine endopeptidase [Thermophagus sp. OGC60D27]|uniref:D-alanyl-D-alanine carboxypeptidase/D-alanyl-D-alanine endopeptidase n=1 Tax=Thermophagus sp. OGC60D27 TaxID=3458415 RepID=UPI0040378DB2